MILTSIDKLKICALSVIIFACSCKKSNTPDRPYTPYTPDTSNTEDPIKKQTRLLADKLVGYYKVSETEATTKTSFQFAGRIELHENNELVFKQLNRTPRTYWSIDFSCTLDLSKDENLTNPPNYMVRGKVLNDSTIDITASFGWVTLYSLKQHWERMDNLADTSSFYQPLPDFPGMIDDFYRAPDDMWLGDAAVDSKGNVYVLEGANVLKKISPSGEVSTVAGTRGSGLSVNEGDGGPAAQAKIEAKRLVIDLKDNIYLSAGLSIRKIDNNGIITTFAGNPNKPVQNNVLATETQINAKDMVMDNSGNMYVTSGYFVRKIATDGMVTIVAGNGIARENTDGGSALEAWFPDLKGVAIGSDGNLYVGDEHRVRKIDLSTGIISNYVGLVKYWDGKVVDSSKMAEAATYGATSILFNGGLMYIAEGPFVQKIDLEKDLVTKFAGIGYEYEAPYPIGPDFAYGNHGPAKQAVLKYTRRLFYFGGKLYICEYDAIRVIK
ncbi:hypothetical protein QEG73_19540 [Chitinophagaceae bacterium 26-R-25]|nr:hypothetical protein [Chitinophagaceae bacterium 26-R-25]